MTAPVTWERRDHIAVVTLNDPERRNVLSRALVGALRHCLDEIESSDVRAIVITGAGKAFCAGADIRDLLEAGWMEGRADGPDPIDIFEQLDKSPRLTLAAVNGVAYGGGFELTLCCDVVIAADRATFAIPEVRHGVIPNTALARLAPIIGRRQALDLALTARPLSAEEAQALGLVKQITASDGLIDIAVDFARNITGAGSPGAIAAIKSALRQHTPTDWKQVRQSLLAVPPAEWREGLSAFLEKRPPDYQRFWSKR